MFDVLKPSQPSKNNFKKNNQNLPKLQRASNHCILAEGLAESLSYLLYQAGQWPQMPILHLHLHVCPDHSHHPHCIGPPRAPSAVIVQLEMVRARQRLRRRRYGCLGSRCSKALHGIVAVVASFRAVTELDHELGMVGWSGTSGTKPSYAVFGLSEWTSHHDTGTRCAAVCGAWAKHWRQQSASFETRLNRSSSL